MEAKELREAPCQVGSPSRRVPYLESEESGWSELSFVFSRKANDYEIRSDESSYKSAKGMRLAIKEPRRT